MNSTYENTGKIYTATNGRQFHVYSKETKSGLRYYKFQSGRMFPISKKEVASL